MKDQQITQLSILGVVSIVGLIAAIGLLSTPTTTQSMMPNSGGQDTVTGQFGFGGGFGGFGGGGGFDEPTQDDTTSSTSDFGTTSSTGTAEEADSTWDNVLSLAEEAHNNLPSPQEFKVSYDRNGASTGAIYNYFNVDTASDNGPHGWGLGGALQGIQNDYRITSGRIDSTSTNVGDQESVSLVADGIATTQECTTVGQNYGELKQIAREATGALSDRAKSEVYRLEQEALKTDCWPEIAHVNRLGEWEDIDVNKARELRDLNQQITSQLEDNWAEDKTIREALQEIGQEDLLTRFDELSRDLSTGIYSGTSMFAIADLTLLAQEQDSLDETFVRNLLVNYGDSNTISAESIQQGLGPRETLFVPIWHAREGVINFNSVDKAALKHWLYHNNERISGFQPLSPENNEYEDIEYNFDLKLQSPQSCDEMHTQKMNNLDNWIAGFQGAENRGGIKSQWNNLVSPYKECAEHAGEMLNTLENNNRLEELLGPRNQIKANNLDRLEAYSNEFQGQSDALASVAAGISTSQFESFSVGIVPDSGTSFADGSGASDSSTPSESSSGFDFDLS